MAQETSSTVPFTVGPVRRIPKGRPLIGRTADLRSVVDAFDAGERLVTLLGPPGMGKTSLAISVAESLSARFGAGEQVRFVDLSNARSELDLCFAVLSVLAERSQVVEALSPAVVGALIEERGSVLLVLDNFEHLAFAAGAVEAWLAASRGLVVLVTSRERLAIDGEHVIELLPLGCPREGEPSDAILASEAVQLFRARAKDAGARVSDDAEALAQIVRMLDGIPLAIELAAARTRLLSPRELALRLGRGEDVLGAATKRAHPRHRTLAHAIDWSWDLLSEDEQRALACCSVFRSSFRVDSAERVIDAGLAGAPGARPRAVELVSALREKSLVHVTGDDRLALYSSIREFAAKKLDQTGAEIACRARLEHARMFGELARRFNDARLLQNETPEPTLHAAARLEREHIVAALAFVTTLPASAEAAALRVELAAASTFLHALPPETVDRELAALELEAADLDARSLATVLLARQGAASSLGRWEEALTFGGRVADDDRAPFGLRCFALVNGGVILRTRGRAREAYAAHEEAERLLSTAPHLPRVVGMNTACMGRLQCDMSNPARARELNTRATEVCDRLGDRWLAGLGLANLAQLEQEAQSFDRALELLTRAVDRFRETGEPQYEAIYAGMCGGLYFEWGKLELARHWYQIGQARLETLILPFPRVVLHGGRAALEAVAGDAGEASAHLELARRHAARSPTSVARIIVEAHTTTVELLRSEPRAHVLERARARVQELERGESDEANVVRTNLDARFALRMLVKTLATLPGESHPRTLLRVSKGVEWFSIGDAPRVELGRRGSLRRILSALCDEHVAATRVALGVETLTARGWPNERVLTEAASTRVRVAIATLRKLGLRDVLLTRDDGYLIDPNARLEVS